MGRPFRASAAWARRLAPELAPDPDLRARAAGSGKSQVTWQLLQQVRAAGLLDPMIELRFALPRRWRFDLAWPERKLAAEVEGGIWVQGRHVQGGGFESDCRKYSEAAVLGWRLIRVTARMVRNGEALELVRRALEAPTNG